MGLPGNLKFILIPILLIGIIGLIFYPVLSFGFVNWDDHSMILENHRIRKFSVENIQWMFTSNVVQGNYQPITWLCYTLGSIGTDSYQASRFHALNLGFHLLNVFLIYSLLRKTGSSLFPAFVLALLFGVHPLRIESVAWISDLKDVVLCFFLLVSIYSWIQFLLTGRYVWSILTLVTFLFALGSKASAGVFPLLCIQATYVWGKEGPLSENIWSKFRRYPMLIGLLGIGGIFAFVGYNAQLTEGGMRLQLFSGPDQAWYSFYQRPFSIIGFYLGKLFWPYPMVNYYQNFEWRTAINPLWTGLGIIGGLGMGYMLFFRPFKDPRIYWGLIWTVVFLFPYLQWIQLGGTMVADRYTYVSLWGLAWVGAPILEYGWNKFRNISVGLCVFFFLAWGGSTWVQLPVWKDSISLWSHAAKEYPGCIRSRLSLAKAYFRLHQYQEFENICVSGRLDFPADPNFVIGQAIALIQTGKMETAISILTQHLQQFPKVYEFRYYLAWAWWKLERYDLAVSEYRKIYPRLRRGKPEIIRFWYLPGIEFPNP
jgi:hypothetical protein